MWLLIICLVIVVLVKIIVDRKQAGRSPPGPHGLPILGNILDIKRVLNETKFYSRAWCRFAKIYGPVVQLRILMGKPCIIVSGREAVIEMLNRPEFDGRPNTFEIRLRTDGERRGVIFTDGKFWSDHRRFTVKVLKRLGFDKASMETTILDGIGVLTKTIENLAEKGTIQNIYEIISTTIIGSFWHLITDSKFQMDREDPRLMEAIEILKENTRVGRSFGGIISRIPILRFIFPRLTGFAELQERQDRMWEYFKETIRKHDESTLPDEPTNLIDAYLKEMQTQPSTLSSSSNFNDDNLIALIKDLFIASVETTTSTIGFVIAYITVKQDIQKKIHDELEETLGKDILPRLSHRNRLPYLQATLAEIARVGNVGPTSVPHRAMSDATFWGYDIKKDSIMLANFMSVHMDENHWGDPDVFRPERFINENGEYVDDPWIMPFGLGRRRCPGEILAKNLVFLIIASLLQKFHFEMAPGCPEPNLLGIDGFTISPPPLNLLVTKRG